MVEYNLDILNYSIFLKDMGALKIKFIADNTT